MSTPTSFRYVYATRTAVIAKGKELRARFDSSPTPGPDAPDEALSIDDLLRAQAGLLAQKAENDKARAALAALQSRQEAAGHAEAKAAADVARLAIDFAAATKRHDVAMESLRVAEIECEEREEEVLNLIDPDLSVVSRQISKADATNRAVREKREHAALRGLLESKRIEKADLDAKLDQLDAAKTNLLSSAKVPVPGIGFSADGLTLNDLPLEQASTAEKLRVGVAIGLALNPTLRFITIHDGSLLDERSMAMVAAMANAANAQVLVERVDDGGEYTIVVEDGEVAPELKSKTVAEFAVAREPGSDG